MIWILIIYIGYLSGFFVASRLGAKGAPFLDILFHHIAGLLIGSIGSMIVIGGLQALLDPQLIEFDALIYYFYVFPIGGLLGAQSAAVIFLCRNQAERQAWRLALVGSLPLLLFGLWSTYELFDMSAQYLSNIRDASFWLFAEGFPLVWIAALWFFVHRHRRSTMV